MSQYVIRVQMRAATRRQYQQLEDAMSAAGYLQTIRGNVGVDYLLPTAEYAKHFYANAAEFIRRQVSAIVDRVSSNEASILVTEVATAAWELLPARQHTGGGPRLSTFR